MSELNDKTKKLNQSGGFLQIYVLNELKKTGWGYEIETPRIVSPFIQNPLSLRDLLYRGDPNKLSASLFPQSVLKSQDHGNKEELSVDIYAGKTLHYANIRLVIEVKKKNPDYVDWCFLQHDSKQVSMRVIKKSITNDGNPTLFDIGETDKHGNHIFVQISEFPQYGYFKNDVADFALALKQNQNIDREYHKSEKTEVDKSVIQILKGLYGTVIEDVIHQVVSGEGYENKPIIFIPIIVTNANLYLVDFNPDDINPETGEITNDPTYMARDSIIYEYPNPKTIQYPEPLNARLNALSRSRLLKSHVLIMTPKGFSAFLSSIDNIPEILGSEN